MTNWCETSDCSSTKNVTELIVTFLYHSDKSHVSSGLRNVVFMESVIYHSPLRERSYVAGNF